LLLFALPLSILQRSITAQVPYLNEAENLLFYSYWTFTDIFEEGGQLSDPWSNSFGMQTIHQVVATVL
jgi:beta-xylosidase